MVTDFTWGFFSDLTGNRVYWMVGPLMCTTLIGSSILTAWPAGDVAKIVAFYFISGGYVTAVTWVRVRNGTSLIRGTDITTDLG